MVCRILVLMWSCVALGSGLNGKVLELSWLSESGETAVSHMKLQQLHPKPELSLSTLVKEEQTDRCRTLAKEHELESGVALVCPFFFKGSKRTRVCPKL